MDRYALFIAPVRLDPDFKTKMQIVRSVCRIAGLGYYLPETDPRGFDLEATIRVILNSDVIVADLSYARPSCYYELGLVEGVGRCAALIANTGTEIFQHSGRGTVSFYDSLASYESVLERALLG